MDPLVFTITSSDSETSSGSAMKSHPGVRGAPWVASALRSIWSLVVMVAQEALGACLVISLSQWATTCDGQRMSVALGLRGPVWIGWFIQSVMTVSVFPIPILSVRNPPLHENCTRSHSSVSRSESV